MKKKNWAKEVLFFKNHGKLKWIKICVCSMILMIKVINDDIILLIASYSFLFYLILLNIYFIICSPMNRKFLRCFASFTHICMYILYMSHDKSPKSTEKRIKSLSVHQEHFTAKLNICLKYYYYEYHYSNINYLLHLVLVAYIQNNNNYYIIQQTVSFKM